MRTWLVRPDTFPLGVSSVVLARVRAASRDDAQRLAAQRFPDRRVVVELAPANAPTATAALERAVAKLERLARRDFRGRRGVPRPGVSRPPVAGPTTAETRDE
jgi:hypothetical protein